jgi:hypothetical protein
MKTQTKRSYWVVSPNVRNNESTVSAWRNASVLGRAAFMGYKPADHSIGHRFANQIEPGDVVLIARRHNFEAEIVGLGVVKGKARKSSVGVKAPQGFGTCRKLSHFVPVSRPPSGIPFLDVLRHTAALVKLHPNSRKAHRKVCAWMDHEITLEQDPGQVIEGKRTSNQDFEGVRFIDSSRHHQLDYLFRTKTEVRRAKKEEARLVNGYRRWLKLQRRILGTARHGKLECDGFEKARKNLIEAKSSVSREHVRMAVGQLLDYAFQIEEKVGRVHMGILLPAKPKESLEAWLNHLNMSLIWREENVFLDNANGQFT